MAPPARHTLTELAAALTASGGNIARAAAALGVSREALRQRVVRSPELAAAVALAKLKALPRVCPTCNGAGVVAAGDGQPVADTPRTGRMAGANHH